jgi:hypothetical protein
MEEKLIRWFFFSVVIALLPIMFNGFSALTRGSSLSLKDLIGRGELLLVSAAISAASGSELFGREGERLRKTRLTLVGCSFVIVFIASYLFADVASLLRENRFVDLEFVCWGSLVVFVCSVATGACCMVLAEVRR